MKEFLLRKFEHIQPARQARRTNGAMTISIFSDVGGLLVMNDDDGVQNNGPGFNYIHDELAVLP